MKKTIFSVSLLLISLASINAQGKRVRITAPVIASYSTSYDKERDRVVVEVKFQEDTDPAKSIPVSDLKVAMKATTADKEPDEVVQDETRIDPQSLSFRFLIDIGKKDKTFNLPKDWKSFQYRVFYTYMRAGKSVTSPDSLIPVNRQAEEITLTAQWGDPSWYNEPGRNTAIIVPVSVGPAIGVRLSLFRKDNNKAEATQEDVTSKDGPKEIKIVAKGINIRDGDEFTVKIEPLGLPVKLQNAENSFKVHPKFTYEIDPGSLDFLKKKLVVTTAAKAFPIEVITTHPGSLMISFNGGPQRPPKGSSGNKKSFELTKEELKRLDDDTYTVSFTGTMDGTGTLLSGEKTFTLTKATKGGLVGTSRFKVEADSLTVTYALTKETTNQWFLSDIDEKGKVRLASAPDTLTCVSKGELYECVAKIDLKNSQVVQPVRDSKDKSVPVKLKIISTAPDTMGEEITSFAFDLVNMGLVKQKLEAVSAGLKDKTLKDPEAKTQIATALGFTGPIDTTTEEGKKQQESIDYIVSALKSKDNSGTKLLSVLKFAGNVAAAYFGIPVRIP